MKNLNKNPLAWFILVIVLGWFIVESRNLGDFVIFAFAVVIAKQIEILNKS